MKHRQILKFIKTIRESIVNIDFAYKNGSCYQFYLILRSIIPEAEAYYNCDHVITKIGNRYYDISGEVERINHIPVNGNYSHDSLRDLRFKFHIFDNSIIKEMRKKQTKKDKKRIQGII